MRKLLPKHLLPIALFLCCTSLLVSFIWSRPVFSDYNSAYNDYTYNYTLYRTAYNDYQVSKSTYLTYHTLTAQSDAIDKLRTVLKARDQVMFVYYNLLQEKMNATAGVESSTQNTFGKVKESEKTWLTDHQKKIDAAGSLDDLNAASSEFESHYPQMDTETKQAIGAVLIAKENTLATSTNTFITNLQAKLVEIRQSGDDTTFADRGIINTNNKLQLFQTKLAAAHDVFYPKTGGTVEFFSGQQKLSEANQYLREAVNFLLEIIKSFTG